MQTDELVEAAIDRLANRSAHIGIVGLGYVGLPLMLRFIEQGFQVLGFDIDSTLVNNLNQGKSAIAHISNLSIANANSNGFRATDDMSEVADVDVVIICVPTPLGSHREPDLSYVLQTATNLSPFLKPGQLVSLESTTYPGTTEDELLPILEQSGLVVGQDIFLVYSPEREDPGNVNFSTRNIPKVCGGVSTGCQKIGLALYESIIDKVVPVGSPKVAELTKLLENIHRAVNIGLVNEMKIVSDRMGIDIHEVIDAAATKPFGFTPYYPGPGLGGHCIPIDPFYFTWKAREFGLHTRFIELAGEINAGMPEWVVAKIADAMNDAGIALSKSKVLVLGLAYKKDVDDTRESPSVEIMELLREKGVDVSYSDPYLASFPAMREHEFELESVTLSSESLSEFDAVLLATDHSGFDYDLILENSKILVDTRGKFPATHPNVVKA